MTAGVRGLRWRIAGLIFPATNFLNRLTVAEPGSQLTNAQFASLTDWFLVAYSLSQALSGKLYDRIANKRGFAAALAFIASVLFGFQAWIDNVQTMASDCFPDGAVGSVPGMGGLGAGIGAILLNHSTGVVVDRFHSYTPILIVAAPLPLLATITLFTLRGPIRRISFERLL